MLWFASVYILLYTLCILNVFSACSLRSVVESCCSPAGFSARLACCVHTRQAIQVRGAGGGRGGGLLGAAPRLQTELHAHTCTLTTLCNPWARSVSSSPLVSTSTHSTFSLSFFLALPLCSHRHPSTLHTSPEHAGRINGPSGESWRVVGEMGGRAGGEGV